MNSSQYIGRVGGLAVALGVGAVMWSGIAVASAENDSPDASSTSSAATGRGPASGPAGARTGRQTIRDGAVGASAPAPRASSRARAAAASAPDLSEVLKADVPKAGAAQSVSAEVSADLVSEEVAQRRPGTLGKRGTVSVGDPQVPGPAEQIPAIAATPAAATSTDLRGLGLLPTPLPAAATPMTLSSIQNPDALAPKPSFRVIGISALSTTVGLTSALLQQFSIAVHLGPSRSAFNQTIDFNGYKLAPGSTELVTSFYGPWTYGPGGLNIVQGQQQYNVVDPATQQTLGTFDTLVSSGTPLGLGKYVQLLVTSADGNVGTDPGDVPPVGSVIAQMKLIAGFGWIYSAMPSQSGEGNEVSLKLVTPLGNIPVPFFNFDAAQGIADRTVDDRPIELGNGYSIAPSDPTGDVYTGTSGFLPLFQVVQSRQRFDIRDSSGTPVGSFEAEVATTWDALGIYTQAVLVTESYGDNVGTAAGQVPPPGTVYNVAYERDDAAWVLSTSMPSPSGNVVSLLENSPEGVLNVLTFPMNGLDASAPPPVKRLPIANGYGLLPISDLTPSGVNGLPPRDVQRQGYQQFGVYDPSGVQQGSFDAMVTKQWDLLGIYSEAIMVTKVTEGQAGTAAGDVPPVGSVFNYVYFGNSGFGSSYWSLPSESGTKISYKIRTPILDIPTWSTYDASAGTDTVIFANPLHTV